MLRPVCKFLLDGSWRTRRVMPMLVIEPTVVLPQQFALNVGSTLCRSGRVVEARRPVLKARVVLQSVSERLDGVPVRATREIVGRQWTRVLCCFPGDRSPGTRVGAATCSRSSAGGVGGRFGCRRASFVLS